MNYKEIQQAKIIAMKNKNILENKVLTLVPSNIKNEAIKEKCVNNISEELVNKILLKELKAAKEAISACPKDRVELLEEYNLRCSILEKYAPTLISDEDEIKMFLINLSNEKAIPLLKKNRGRFMKTISTEYKNQFEMAVINAVLGELLQ